MRQSLRDENSEQAVMKEGYEYAAYVMVEIPMGDVKASVVKAIEAGEALHGKVCESPKLGFFA